MCVCRGPVRPWSTPHCPCSPAPRTSVPGVQPTLLVIGCACRRDGGRCGGWLSGGEIVDGSAGAGGGERGGEQDELVEQAEEDQYRHRAGDDLVGRVGFGAPHIEAA